MGRKNHKSSGQVQVTREVYALAVLAQHRAEQEMVEGEYSLPVAVFGQRRITRRMAKALRAQAV